MMQHETSPGIIIIYYSTAVSSSSSSSSSSISFSDYTKYWTGFDGIYDRVNFVIDPPTTLLFSHCAVTDLLVGVVVLPVVPPTTTTIVLKKEKAKREDRKEKNENGRPPNGGGGSGSRDDSDGWFWFWSDIDTGYLSMLSLMLSKASRLLIRVVYTRVSISVGCGCRGW